MNKQANPFSSSPVSRAMFTPSQMISTNPFDSDSESESDSKSSRVYSAPPPSTNQNPRIKYISPKNEKCSGAYSTSQEQQYRNDFLESGGVDNQTVQELENYAVYKAEKTTQSVKSCLQIAEEIREDAIRTLTALDQQGDQITKSHLVAAEMDQDLTRGEKLLGSLGGIFSRTWKPKLTLPIKGPRLFRENFFERKGNNNLEQREDLGLSSNYLRGQSSSAQRLKHSDESVSASALEKVVVVEKAKQDDTLSDLSNILGQLKYMAVDMGSEIDRQNKSLNHMQDDVDQLNIRVKGSNQRGRRLLGK